ncbi:MULTISPECIES: myo-inosose-2 dehydratase [unclassified Sporosarcina]|uniref:myo-inosose-2 dehydratase n=1 Tax=unclassified Sporosarcina TaxID=2647733 RepID=UPI002041AF93|nr:MULTISPECIES: myo-inosose-2 dehydratase [unclassified Sporosarcina]GKV65860.1 myo-inosose-2 dehydratase [Sporosarcina sp. NCCP-2331]GLB55985.1 myo-inosose-2 dehydratase [Sporosarcina sp. NCCP-2378]
MGLKNTSFKLGIHPINWVGEDVQEHGDFYEYDQVMEEISSLGVKGTEVSRKFPKDPNELKKALNKYGLSLTTQWKSVFFTDPSRQKEELDAYRKHVQFLKLFDCKVVSTAEIGGSMLNQDPTRKQDETFVEHLKEDQWNYLAEGLNKAGEICQEYGMDLVYHHHAGTVVEQPSEIDKLMEMTDPALVSLLYDTGHALYGTNDPVELLQKYYDRVKYIHLKDIRKDVLEKALSEKYSLRKSLRSGLFTVPGDGCIDFTSIIKIMMEHNYNRWALIEGEQDPLEHNPYDYAENSIHYLQQIVDQINQENYTKANN